MLTIAISSLITKLIISQHIIHSIMIVYITPEKLVNFVANIRSLYQQDMLSFFAIDEAHCLSGNSEENLL